MEKEMEFLEAVTNAGQRAAGWMREQLDAVTIADADDDESAKDEAQQAIDQTPLSVQVRNGWKSPGEISDGPEEFEILISTGGPASRVIGELDEYCQPLAARFEYQDWFKPWTAAHLSEEETKTVLEWASTFYFGY